MVWTTANWTLLLLLSYMIGAFPTVYMLGRITKGKGTRRLGDGNAGAANAYHQLRSKVEVRHWSGLRRPALAEDREVASQSEEVSAP